MTSEQLSRPEIPKLQLTCHSYCPTSNFQNFISPFEADFKEGPLKLKVVLIDLPCWEDLNSKFVACHILDFFKNHELPSGRYLKFITHTQQVVSMFGTIYCYEQLFSANWNMLRVRCIRYCQIITCLMSSLR